jgi:hypothetical protein
MGASSKSDVYLSERRLAGDVKVSLHEPGPARFALTREHLGRPGPLVLPAELTGTRVDTALKCRVSLRGQKLASGLRCSKAHEP